MSEHTDPGRVPDEWTLMAYTEGRLDPGSARGREIAAWLRTHPQAQQRADEYARQDRQIRAAFAPKLAEAVPARLQPSAIRWRQRRTRLRWTGAAAAATAAALLVLALPTAQRAPADSLEGFAQDVLQQIEADAPAQVATAGVNSPPVFMPAGFELAGERSMEASSGLMTEQLYHDAAGRKLRLFIGEEPREAAIEPQWLHADGQHLVYWENRDRRYALSGEIDMPELQQLAAQMMQAPDTGLQLAGDTATAVETTSTTAFEAAAPMTLPEAAQPASTAPTLGVDPLGQIETQAPAEQPLL